MLTDLHLLRFIAKPNERVELFKKWCLYSRSGDRYPFGDNTSCYPDITKAFNLGLTIELNRKSSCNLSFEECSYNLSALADELRRHLSAELLIEE